MKMMNRGWGANMLGLRRLCQSHWSARKRPELGSLEAVGCRRCLRIRDLVRWEACSDPREHPQSKEENHARTGPRSHRHQHALLSKAEVTSNWREDRSPALLGPPWPYSQFHESAHQISVDLCPH